MIFIQSDRNERFYARPAELKDAKDIWLWRNDPVTRANSANSMYIRWVDHIAWFTALLDDPDRVIYLVTLVSGDEGWRGHPVAVVRFDRLPVQADCWRVSLNLNPNFRGHGHGRHILLAACIAFFDEHGASLLHAEIRPDNVASRKVFSALGFSPLDKTETGTLGLYERAAIPLPRPSEL